MSRKQESALERCIRARRTLLLDQPFFGLLAMKLELVEDPTCDTMWTDGVHIGSNPDFVAECSDNQLRGVIAHEILHVAAGHTWRKDFRNHEDWNEACDYAINPIVIDARMSLPDNVLFREDFRGFSAEAIYNKLKEERSQQPKGGQTPQADSNQNNSPNPGGSSSGEAPQQDGTPQGDNPEEGSSSPGGSGSAGNKSGKGWQRAGEVRQGPCTEEHIADWQMSIEAAARMQGNLPGSLRNMLTETLAPRVNWKEVLRDFVETSFAPTDYTWSQPARQYLHMGLYLPRVFEETTPPIVVVRDTSASTGEYLKHFNSELLDIFDRVQPKELHVLDVDATVQKVQAELTKDDELSLAAAGGGGTRFEPAFQWVEDNQVSCCCMIYLTDLCGSFPAVPPDYPVLWVVPEGASRGVKAPFGVTLELDAA